MKKLLLAVLLSSLVTGASADGGTVGGQLENDYFGAGTDRHYSNGTRLFYRGAAGDSASWLKALAQWLPLVKESADSRLLVELGQSIYTPEDLTSSAPLPGERPYVGWLYTTLSALFQSDDSYSRVGLSLGLVGPGALAGSTQETIHGLLDMQHPEGWESQPSTRPAIAVLLDRFWRLVKPQDGDLIEVEVLPHAGMTVGTIKGEGRGGMLMRFGNKLNAQALPGAVAPGFAPHKADEEQGFAWSVFVDVGGRAVTHNAAVEGLEGEGPEAKALVGEMTTGVSMSWAGITVTYSRNWLGPEAKGETEGDSYGGFGLAFDF